MKLDLRRGIILVLMGAVLVMSYVWLQGLFDDGDHRKALRLVHEFRAGAIDRAIETRHAGALASPLQWESEILSGFWGHVRVHARAFLADGKSLDYQFDVNLSDSSIHPGNEDGRSILAALTGPGVVPRTSAAASPAAATTPSPSTGAPPPPL